MPLESLPTELLCSCICLLDPIGLISLSQTSKHFRQLINPQKRHFAERLLQLETIDEYGGGTPRLRPRHVHLAPNCYRHEWHDIRWACTSCLRLLPHRCFRNSSILKLAYQKPTPRSPLNDPLTTWEPLAYKVRKPKVEEEARKKQLRKRHHFCVTASIRRRLSVPDEPADVEILDRFLEHGVEEFNGIDHETFLSIETWDKTMLMQFETDKTAAELSGTNRRNRKCLECQYLRRELRPESHGADGIVRVPIQANRMVLFYSELDRYFPGLGNCLGQEIPLVVEHMYFMADEQTHQQTPIAWTMWMVRCPECTRWKELRDFRVQVRDLLETRYGVEGGRRYLLHQDESREKKEELLKDACCNTCFAKANGRLELGRALGRWLEDLIDMRLEQVSLRLKGEARNFHWDRVQLEREALGPYLLALRETVSCFGRGQNSILSKNDIRQLKGYRARAVRMWEQIDKDDHFRRPRLNEEGLGAWGSRHELCELVLHKLKSCKKLSKKNPEALAAWALDRDESTWDYEVEGALTRKLNYDNVWAGERSFRIDSAS
ncbi:hypothetical protein CEP53_002871 [Fusarium sp. AF-6]|nr:hypothetical protein CEP53_002871 [Fusarium sp. AF-6]